MRRMIFRFKVWNDWRKNCTNTWWHKLMVLLGLHNSPSFEFELSVRRISYELGKMAYQAGQTIQEVGNKIKAYLEVVNELYERNTTNKHKD